MKKMITISLILALLLVSFSAALAEEETFLGCYASYSPLTTGSPSMKMIYFAEDGTCYFMIQSFRPDEPGLGRAFVGTWEIVDGVLVAKTGNNTSSSFSFTDDFSIAVDKDLFEIYIHISPFIDSFNSELGR